MQCAADFPAPGWRGLEPGSLLDRVLQRKGDDPEDEADFLALDDIRVAGHDGCPTIDIGLVDEGMNQAARPTPFCYNSRPEILYIGCRRHF